MAQQNTIDLKPPNTCSAAEVVVQLRTSDWTTTVSNITQMQAIQSQCTHQELGDWDRWVLTCHCTPWAPGSCSDETTEQTYPANSITVPPQMSSQFYPWILTLSHTNCSCAQKQPLTVTNKTWRMEIQQDGGYVWLCDIIPWQVLSDTCMCE